MLFGVFSVHSPESCPLNNDASKKKVVDMFDMMQPNLAEFGIEKIMGSYVSALEHEWVLILEAESAHKVEQFCIKVGIPSINTVKIVPLNKFEDIVNRVRAGSH